MGLAMAHGTGDLGDMRSSYSAGELRREELDPDPIGQFELWFDQACKAGLPEPNAMGLATVSTSGQPSLRTVLLKSYDHQGFVFFTNYHSRKAREISDNPKVALLFTWLILERQITITGTASRIGTAESLKYFLTRPRGSQIAAWISSQSQVISSRAMLDVKLHEMKRKFVDGQIPLPSFWGGYRVRPQTIEFWQGRPNRLHDRFLYTRQDDDRWSIERLAP
jgi:pyridoxamine 5'-phosphate oxidase